MTPPPGTAGKRGKTPSAKRAKAPSGKRPSKPPASKPNRSSAKNPSRAHAKPNPKPSSKPNPKSSPKASAKSGAKSGKAGAKPVKSAKSTAKPVKSSKSTAKPVKSSKSGAKPAASGARTAKASMSGVKTGKSGVKGSPKGQGAKPKPSTSDRPSATSGKPTGKSPKGARQGSQSGADGDGADADLSVSGQLYRNGKLVEGVLHIDTRSGRIVRVAKSTIVGRHLDFGKRAILPGALDVHVHFREPGHTHKEDLATGSAAAALGGVTGIVDMPNTLPATTTLRTLKEKLALMERRCVVDYAAWAGGSWYTGDLPAMLKLAAGVKVYLGATTGDLLMDEPERFQQILAAAGEADRPVVLHAESQRILNQLRRQEGTLADHDQLRPPAAEVESIYEVMKGLAAVKRPPRIHIAHVASAEAVQAALTAKFSVGVTPHHLLLDTASPLTHAYGKVNPPLRHPTSRKALWEQFTAGRIPVVESDHAPHTAVEKEDNFHSAPSGLPGVETMVPLLLAQVKSGKAPLDTVVDAVTTNPARLLGLQDRGALEPGLRADFAVYDLKQVTKVQASRLHSKCGWSPFEGHNAVFPTHTYLAGRPVVEEGGLVAEPGNGKAMVPN